MSLLKSTRVPVRDRYGAITITVSKHQFSLFSTGGTIKAEVTPYEALPIQWTQLTGSGVTWVSGSIGNEVTFTSNGYDTKTFRGEVSINGKQLVYEVEFSHYAVTEIIPVSTYVTDTEPNITSSLNIALPYIVYTSGYPSAKAEKDALEPDIVDKGSVIFEPNVLPKYITFTPIDPATANTVKFTHYQLLVGGTWVTQAVYVGYVTTIKSEVEGAVRVVYDVNDYGRLVSTPRELSLLSPHRSAVSVSKPALSDYTTDTLSSNIDTFLHTLARLAGSELVTIESVDYTTYTSNSNIDTFLHTLARLAGSELVTIESVDYNTHTSTSNYDVLLHKAVNAT